MFVACLMMIWAVGLGAVERMRGLQHALCNSGSKFPAEIPNTFSCETMYRDIEILSYLWLAATLAVPFALFRRRQLVPPETLNNGPNR
jgi:hypothetical protein